MLTIITIAIAVTGAAASGLTYVLGHKRGVVEGKLTAYKEPKKPDPPPPKPITYEIGQHVLMAIDLDRDAWVRVVIVAFESERDEKDRTKHLRNVAVVEVENDPTHTDAPKKERARKQWRAGFAALKPLPTLDDNQQDDLESRGYRG